MAKILGFSGKKQSGKTTAVKCVRNHFLEDGNDSGVVVCGFFDAAKEWFRMGVGLPAHIDMDSQETKDIMLPSGLTVREGLQKFGTDYCRSICLDWWVNVWIVRIRRYAPNVLILVPDVRFPNELTAIQEMGGHVIRLLRAPFDDRHESETALDEIEAASLVQLGLDGLPLRVHGTEGRMFDAVIDNRDMTIPEQNAAVLNLVAERGWI